MVTILKNIKITNIFSIITNIILQSYVNNTTILYVIVHENTAVRREST